METVLFCLLQSLCRSFLTPEGEPLNLEVNDSLTCSHSSLKGFPNTALRKGARDALRKSDECKERENHIHQPSTSESAVVSSGLFPFTILPCEVQRTVIRLILFHYWNWLKKYSKWDCSKNIFGKQLLFEIHANGHPATIPPPSLHLPISGCSFGYVNYWGMEIDLKPWTQAAEESAWNPNHSATGLALQKCVLY